MSQAFSFFPSENYQQNLKIVEHTNNAGENFAFSPVCETNTTVKAVPHNKKAFIFSFNMLC